MVLKSRLFVSAYAPLFGLLAIRFDALLLRVICALLFLLGLITLLLMMRARRRESEEPYELDAVEDAGSKTAAYLSAYILPLLSVSDPRWEDIVIYILFLLLVFVVSLAMDLAQVNPLVYMLGYRVFAVKTVGRFEGYLLSRRRSPVAGDRTIAVSVIAGVLLEKRLLEESEDTA